MISRKCNVCGENSFQTSKLHPWVCTGTQFKYCGRDKTKLINDIDIGTKVIVDGRTGYLLSKSNEHHFTVQFKNYVESFLYVDIANKNIRVKVNQNDVLVPMEELYSYC